MSSASIALEESFYTERQYRILKILDDRMLSSNQIQKAYCEEFEVISTNKLQKTIREMVESGLIEEEYSHGHFRKLFYRSD